MVAFSILGEKLLTKRTSLALGGTAGLPPHGSESHPKTVTTVPGGSPRGWDASVLESLTEPRTLYIDVECSPNLAYVWDVWQQNVNPQMLLETKEVLCFAYQWKGQTDVFCWSQFHDGKDSMLGALWNLLDKADIVVDYNGDRYDIPRINTELLLGGFDPPSPYKHIDLFKTVKRKFDFTYMSLDHVCGQLGLINKTQKPGFETWLGCLKDDEESWNNLVTYNMGDIPPLVALHKKLLPWIPSYPNTALWGDGKRKCPRCQSTSIQFRGFAYTGAGKFRQILCNDCGGWSRLPSRDSTVDIRVVAEG